MEWNRMEYNRTRVESSTRGLTEERRRARTLHVESQTDAGEIQNSEDGGDDDDEGCGARRGER